MLRRMPTNKSCPTPSGRHACPAVAQLLLVGLVLLVPPLNAQPELPYKPVVGWGELPDGYVSGQGMAVAVDHQGGVWFYNRGSHPLMQFSGDGSLIRAGLAEIARAGNMSRLARDAGLSREGLYKALSKDGNPSFATVTRIVRALGLRLRITV